MWSPLHSRLWKMAWWHPKVFGMELWDQGYLSHPCPLTFFFLSFFFWIESVAFCSSQGNWWMHLFKSVNRPVHFSCRKCCYYLPSLSSACQVSGSLWFAENGGSVSVSHFSSAHTKWCFAYISLVELREWSFQRTMVWTLVTRNLMRDRGNHSQRWQLNAQTSDTQRALGEKARISEYSSVISPFGWSITANITDKSKLAGGGQKEFKGISGSRSGITGGYAGFT